MHGDARGRHGQRGAAAQAGRGPEHRTNAGTVTGRWINSAAGREVNASGRLTRSSLRRGHRGQGLTEGTGQDGPSKPGSTTMPRNYQKKLPGGARRDLPEVVREQPPTPQPAAQQKPRGQCNRPRGLPGHTHTGQPSIHAMGTLHGVEIHPESRRLRGPEGRREATAGTPAGLHPDKRGDI